jgi:hypothetical protein
MFQEAGCNDTGQGHVPLHPAGSYGNDLQCFATTSHGDVLVGEVQSTMGAEIFILSSCTHDFQFFSLQIFPAWTEAGINGI